MPTDKQAKQAQIGAANWATKMADERWQLIVVALEAKVVQLEEEIRQLKEGK